jgi:HEAT repeat protein
MLDSLIQKISGWQQLNPQELFAQLDSKTILYQDKKPYRLDDIAKLIGDVNMNTFLDVVRAAGYDWMITQAASGFYPYEDPINSRLRLLNHPLCLQIANHTNRMISVLEQNNITTTVEEIAQVQASMKHEERKARLKTAGANQYNRFCDAVENLQPSDPDPVL